MISNFSMMRRIVTSRFKSPFNFKTPTSFSSSLRSKFGLSSIKFFSESTAEGPKLFLTQQEAYILNEHDRMLIQLNSNSVPLTVMPKFMKELAQYCYSLSKYKQYIKGWQYVAKFFSENLKNFTNEELFTYLFIFAYTKYLGENYPRFWDEVCEEVLSRTLNKEDYLDFLKALNLVEYKNQDVVSKLVSKLDSYTMDYTDNLRLGVYLESLYDNKSDPIWEKILSAVENKDIVLEKLPTAFIFNFVNVMKTHVSRDSPLYAKVDQFYHQNFNSLHPEDALAVNIAYVSLNKFSTEELADIIVQTVRKIVNATEYSRFYYYTTILHWCVNHPKLIDALLAHKDSFPGNFVIPTKSLVNDFADLVNQISSQGIAQNAEGHSLIQKFSEKYAEQIGYKVSFAQQAFADGFFNIEAITKLKESQEKKF